MQFIKALLSGDFLQRNFSHKNALEVNKEQVGSLPGRLRVGIIGTGKIGVDLLVKVRRSPWMDCVIFSGRNLQSVGMCYAAELGVPVSDQGINAFFEPRYRCDIVFDATSAANHIEHAQVFDKLGILAIDMTPSQIGECCVPALGMKEVLENKNISMISCGGQSSIPVAQVLAKVIPNVQKIAVKSIVSPNSIGPGTLANLDEYYHNTKAGLKKYTGINAFDVELLVDEVNPETRMLTSVTAYSDAVDLDALWQPLMAMLQQIQAYVPGYKMESAPVLIDGGVRIDLSVEGLGDYLPKYAGNLDIINCAAIAVAEHYAQAVLASRQTKRPLVQYHRNLQLEY
ncbi:acetylating acetaldehyde dehydrogenase [Cellvibrio sp. OA-2007]|uniref:acetylating acetaldehyde dehydrogenase n=1 Tax=Cellvibrio sp. OA-2007 TaxID=529823 RepID=UPI000781399E|nr:acetylating acetaldehyde dehydrogenase [Cellvibrio sp. OA-2007]